MIMIFDMPPHVTRITGGIAGTAILIAVSCVAFAQPSPQRPGEVPYLNFPPVTIPGNSAPSPVPPSPPAGQRSKAGAPAPANSNNPANLDILKQRAQELAGVQADQKRAIENEAELRREVETIGDDRRKLSQQLIDTAGRIRAVEGEIARTEERIVPLDEREQRLRSSLNSRRGVIAEVLAALQRIGRHPPPAIMVRPEDALQSLRSAMLLGAVLPEMRQETNAILTDLSEMVRLRYE